MILRQCAILPTIFPTFQLSFHCPSPPRTIQENLGEIMLLQHVYRVVKKNLYLVDKMLLLENLWTQRPQSREKMSSIGRPQYLSHLNSNALQSTAFCHHHKRMPLALFKRFMSSDLKSRIFFASSRA